MPKKVNIFNNAVQKVSAQFAIGFAISQTSGGENSATILFHAEWKGVEFEIIF